MLGAQTNDEVREDDRREKTNGQWRRRKIRMSGGVDMKETGRQAMGVVLGTQNVGLLVTRSCFNHDDFTSGRRHTP